MPESHELPEWFPDWARETPNRPRPQDQDEDLQIEEAAPQPSLLSAQAASDRQPFQHDIGTSPPASSGPAPGAAPGLLAPASHTDHRSVSHESTTSADVGGGFKFEEPRHVVYVPDEDRLVKRKLRPLHIFMITINATLGTGLYWRGGLILEMGGPLAVLLSFMIVGILAWSVMQCLTEMLCIWPIPGALSVYVGEFVDVELGIAVGVAYWFTYSVSFAALIATTAALFDFWPSIRGNANIDGAIVYFLIPAFLIATNAFGIQIYGWFEVVTGTLKIAMLLTIVVTLIAIRIRAGDTSDNGNYWTAATAFDTGASKDWGTALMMCLSIATFAYVGVEIVAASALEARWPKRRHADDRVDSNISRQSNDTLIGSTVKFSSIYISILAMIAYTLSGLLVTLDIDRAACQLPRLSWAGVSPECAADADANTVSAFVIIAQNSLIPYLPEVFNVFLIFTALTCANTNLYVASRALFGLTSRLEGGPGQRPLLRFLAWFGRTNHRKVPMRAMIFSALAFWWVPFLQLKGGTGSDTPIGMFIEVLAEMGSVGVLIVWACECLAFIRFYHCIKRHRIAIQAQKISQVRRWDKDDWNDYPYRSHGQPFVAYFALAGCIGILVVANSAALWNGFYRIPFLSSYLIVFVFLGLWVLLKIFRGAKWSPVDLSKAGHVIKKLKDLHDIRQGAA
ncbi:amino acid transporter [Echria macrotheca]|uniref:Amino acid transporter n=1 Tax=Echria macrotheca TaxID=438768 RepID=A0AAJ0F922_9PEZI|nr:amino acid transporter [Echria macrotheca]